jgi:hypothetical protein
VAISFRDFLRRYAGNPWLTLTPILGIALAFRLYDLDAITLINDEPQDMPAALRHAEHLNPFDLPEWLQRADPSQARLPYYLTAMGVRLLSDADASTFWLRAGRVNCPPTRSLLTMVVVIGVACLICGVIAPAPLGRWASLLPLGMVLLIGLTLGWPTFPFNQLVAGRIVSGLIGAAGVWATYALGREIFGYWAGLYAAATLALSTMHIAYSRCAVTTGDTFIATFFILALWLLYRSTCHDSGRATIGCAAAMGLAFGSKVSAVLLWPICVLYSIAMGLLRKTEGSSCEPFKDRPRQSVWSTCLYVGLGVLLAIVFFWPVLFGANSPTARLSVWLVGLAIYLAGTLFLVRSPWEIGRGHRVLPVIGVLIGGGVVAAFSTPYHLRMEALTGLAAWWRDYGAKSGDTPNYALDAFSIVELLLLHTGFPVNLLAVGGVVWGCKRRNLPWGSLVLITLAVYAGAITLLHQKADYYLMPLLLLLHVVAGGALVALLSRLGSGHFKLACALGTTFVALLAVQFSRTAEIHPHYLVDGQEWANRLILGPKLGPSNLQYQGARPVVEWLAQNAAPGSRVAIFFPADPHLRRFRSLVLAILAFEVQRSTELQAKAFVLGSVNDVKDLPDWNYIVVFSEQKAPDQLTAEFDQVFEAKLNNQTGALLFKRRV